MNPLTDLLDLIGLYGDMKAANATAAALFHSSPFTDGDFDTLRSRLEIALETVITTAVVRALGGRI